MHVSGRSGKLRARREPSGFSLVEVVVASGLLMLTITVVTFCVTSVSASGARLERVMDGDRAVRLVAERLAAMPFYGSGADAGAVPHSEVKDLLGAVFPHADAARNTPTARYVRIDEEDATAGSFVTLFNEGGVEVLCVARFLAGEGGPPLAPVAVEGWALSDGDQPPGCALTVQLKATSHSAARSAGFTRTALAMAPIHQASPAAAT